jgi:hypothetical protein
MHTRCITYYASFLNVVKEEKKAALCELDRLLTALLNLSARPWETAVREARNAEDNIADADSGVRDGAGGGPTWARPLLLALKMDVVVISAAAGNFGSMIHRASIDSREFI